MYASMHMLGGSGAMLPQCKLDVLRSLLKPYLHSNSYLDLMPLEYWAKCFWSTAHHVVTGSHMSRVSMSDEGIAVDWTMAVHLNKYNVP